MGTNNKQVMAHQKETHAVDNNGTHVTQQEVTTSAYSGPLPRAEDFAKYETVCPGAANRIIAMAEKQAAHRQEIEKAVISAANRNSLAGIGSALVLAVLVLFCGVYCILQGHDWAGGAIVGIDLVSLCGVFVFGTKMRNQ